MMHAALVAKLDIQHSIYMAAKEANDREAEARAKGHIDDLLDRLADYHHIVVEDI